MTKIHHVVCFQQRLTHYREVFFHRCRERLSDREIRFDLVHGKPDSEAIKKNDRGFLSWALEVDQATFNLGRVRGVWVPMPRGLPTPDLVVVTQENKLLANYAWLIKRNLGGPKVAFWGHGRNFQSDAPGGLKERLKKRVVGQVDWWFAYTQLTRKVLRADQYPDERITVLDNAIDNEAFQTDLASVSRADLEELQSVVGTGPVALFCGSLYPDKLIGLMIEAADRIRLEIPDFALVVIGDGPSASEVKAAAQTRPWLHPVGVKKGRDKAVWFKLSSVVLNPGLVGLHIVDSFCAGVPMVTTAEARHSPEIAYLDSGVNGLIVQGGVQAYADAVVSLLNDSHRLSNMRDAALKSAERYTLDNMVKNFCDGVERCLSLPRK